MPAKCDICGVAALENESFVVESVPFRGSKVYCPACRQRLYYRVYAVLTVALLSMGIVGVFDALLTGNSLLESVPCQLALLVAMQWFMILPHELGHALAARSLGYDQIRILVGAGKPIFSLRFFGIPILFNLIPFGGVTLSQPTAPFTRRRLLGFVGAGLLVNLAAAGFAFYLASPGEVLDFHGGSAARICFWANLIVLVENLAPRQVHTPFGPLNSDGLQLFNILFHWNKPPKPGPTTVPLWELAVRLLLKWILLLIMGGGALIFLLLAAFPFFLRNGESAWGLKIGLPAIMLPMAALTIYMSVRIAKDPIPRVRTKQMTAGFRPAVVLTPELDGLVQKAIERGRQSDFVAAQTLLDQVFAGLAKHPPETYSPLRLLKLDFLIAQTHVEQAEKICLDWVEQAPTNAEKVMLLDGFACLFLYRTPPTHLEVAERFARNALEIAPGSLTLMGSLGGLLTEQKRFAEAEPLLRECFDRSPVVHERGICALFLGASKLNAGDKSEAKKLMELAILLHPVPWLLAKAEAKLKELDA